MKTVIIAAAVVAASAFAAPAMAGGGWGKVTQCYDKVWVGPQYQVHKKLIREAEYKYEYRDGVLCKVYYPAVYEEIRTKVSDGYYLAQPIGASC